MGLHGAPQGARGVNGRGLGARVVLDFCLYPFELGKQSDGWSTFIIIKLVLLSFGFRTWCLLFLLLFLLQLLLPFLEERLRTRLLKAFEVDLDIVIARRFVFAFLDLAHDSLYGACCFL